MDVDVKTDGAASHRRGGTTEGNPRRGQLDEARLRLGVRRRSVEDFARGTFRGGDPSGSVHFAWGAIHARCAATRSAGLLAFEILHSVCPLVTRAMSRSRMCFVLSALELEEVSFVIVAARFRESQTSEDGKIVHRG